MATQPRPHTFDLQNCRDMVAKLGRELERMQHDRHDRQAVTDHAVNFALTAWHLIDWTWAEMKGDPDMRGRVLRLVGCSPRDLNRKSFTAWCVRECPDLIACQVIATATKHFGCDRVEAAEIEARVSATPGYGGALSTGPISAGPISAFVPGSYVPKVIRGDRAELAGPVFERVRAFWTGLIAEAGSDRPPPPAP